MTDKKFNAILAKNALARELKSIHNSDIPITYFLEQLKTIENYIGEGNQPSVEDIFYTTKFNL